MSSEKERKLRAQMAALQAELDAELVLKEEKHQKARDTRVAATPSPRKESKDTHGTSSSRRLSAPVFKRTTDKEKRSDPLPAVARPSKMADALEQLNFSKTEILTQTEVTVGPPSIDYTPPFDDPHFQRHEPNSHINLKSREFSHEDLQEYLRGRYYISPSHLYSVARLTPNRQAYEVPVAGDWVTIAVIAERGPISVSRAKSTADSSGDGPKKTSGRKYLTLKLVDFGHRGSDSQSSKAVIKGDAVLNLILFEADSYSTIRNSDGLADRVYRGGSGGAFEACASFRQGTVIAILNSKILKPFQRGAAKPHPTDNVLALTPESASSIVIIGQSRDLGTCHAVKRDGKQCGSWCDLRVSEVCEYHIQHSIQSRRASRPEFSVGTSGMASASHPSHRGSTTPDTAKKWGLFPRAGSNPSATKTSASLGGSTTYVLPGQVISLSSSISSGPEYVGEAMGRDKHERKKRKREVEAQELELQRLLEKDGGNSEGAKTLAKAREAILGKPVKPGPKDKDKEVASGEDSRPRKRVFSATDIQRIGFDPTAKQGKRLRDDEKTVQVLNELQSSKPKVKLGPRPGPKIRSGVSIPAALSSASSVQQKVGPNAIGAESSATTLSSRSPQVHADDELEIV